MLLIDIVMTLIYHMFLFKPGTEKLSVTQSCRSKALVETEDLKYSLTLKW